MISTTDATNMHFHFITGCQECGKSGKLIAATKTHITKTIISNDITSTILEHRQLLCDGCYKRVTSN